MSIDYAPQPTAANSRDVPDWAGGAEIKPTFASSLAEENTRFRRLVQQLDSLQNRIFEEGLTGTERPPEKPSSTLMSNTSLQQELRHHSSILEQLGQITERLLRLN